MKPWRLATGAGLAFGLAFATPVPAPQMPELSAQVPDAARPCPPAPDPGGIWDFDPCVDYWAVVSTSAHHTAALKALRAQLDALDARIATLEKENKDG